MFVTKGKSAVDLEKPMQPPSHPRILMNRHSPTCELSLANSLHFLEAWHADVRIISRRGGADTLPKPTIVPKTEVLARITYAMLDAGLASGMLYFVGGPSSCRKIPGAGAENS